MKKGDMVRVRIGQDAHGHGGFIAMGRVIDENDHMLVLSPEAFLLVKNDMGTIEELPDDAKVENALRTVQVGRKSYLGQTKAVAIQRVGVVEAHSMEELHD